MEYYERTNCPPISPPKLSKCDIKPPKVSKSLSVIESNDGIGMDYEATLIEALMAGGHAPNF
jgi:hypothetical protein